MGRHLSDTFSIKNSPEQGSALLPLLWSFPSESVIRKVSAKRKGLNFNKTHQLLVRAVDTNLLDKNMHSIEIRNIYSF